MKKFATLLFIFFVGCNCVFAKDDIMTLDLYNNHNKIASEKLYKFLLKSYGRPKCKINELWDITKENTLANFVDLNDDGIPEIVGFTSALGWGGTMGTSLYVLKVNDKSEYENIYYSAMFYPWLGIKILKEKTNKFCDIEIEGSYDTGKGKVSGVQKAGRFLVKFDGKIYNKSTLVK